MEIMIDKISGLTETDRATILGQFHFDAQIYDLGLRATVLQYLGRFTSYLQARRVEGDGRDPEAIKNEWLRIGLLQHQERSPYDFFEGIKLRE